MQISCWVSVNKDPPLPLYASIDWSQSQQRISAIKFYFTPLSDFDTVIPGKNGGEKKDKNDKKQMPTIVVSNNS